MNRRRAIAAGMVAALVLGLVIAAAAGGLDGGDAGSGQHAVPTTVPEGGSAGASARRGSPGGSRTNQGSPGGAPDQPDPHVLRHPHVPTEVRTYPRLKPSSGKRNTAFVLSFRLRWNLGPHGHTWSYYGVIVSPLTGHPRHGCYGFGRYVMRGRRGQIARVQIHPRGRLWCPGTYQASVYLTGRPYCPPSRRPSRQPHPCSTASYPPRPTGWAYFSVR